MWQGDYRFVISSLVAKNFRVRYRSMWLGMLWSLIVPLVSMTVLTFITTVIFANPGIKYHSLSILCGLVPFNFFALAWSSGTTSLLENATLVKRVPVPRHIFPMAAVFSTGTQLLVQIGLLLTGVLLFGRGVNIHWLWLPLMWALEILFVLGLALAFSAVNVYVRDTRYIVESANTIMFWLVPIFYSFALIPSKFRLIYEVNPVAALVMMMRTVLLDGHAPVPSTLRNLVCVSLLTFTVGWLVFRKLQKGFYEYL